MKKAKKHHTKAIKKNLHVKHVASKIKITKSVKNIKVPKKPVKKILVKHIKKSVVKHVNKNRKIVKEVRKSKKNTTNIILNIVADDNKEIKNAIEVKIRKPKDGAKRVIIVHGWDGDISKGWFPWAKKQLETQGFKVIMERMPSPNKPEIDAWVEMLGVLSGDVDEKTYFIGHSIGCQTIMRLLEKIDSEKIGGAVFLAGWFDLTEQTYKEDPKTEKETRKIAEPWISTRFDLYKVKSKFTPGTVTAIFSEDDPYVDLKNAEAFKEWLDARIIIENGKGHFEEAKISEIPLLIEEILRISKDQKDVLEKK